MDTDIMDGKPSLISRRPNRIFTFGCSFTRFIWPTWAHIIAHELNVPLYNYGMCGAGNQFIFNTLMQADTFHTFTEDDLVMICWSSLAREDRYKDGLWILEGNVYLAEHIYDKNYIKKWADDFGYAIRDYAVIKAAWEFLTFRKCQFHFLSMLDITLPSEIESHILLSDNCPTNIVDFYQFYLSKINKSFYEILWNNNLDDKRYKNLSLHPNFTDCHPSVTEHLNYLQHTFNHNFSDNTISSVKNTESLIMKTLIEDYLSKNKSFIGVDFSEFFFKKSEDIMFF